jgi:hypothetical protein
VTYCHILYSGRIRRSLVSPVEMGGVRQTLGESGGVWWTIGLGMGNPRVQNLHTAPIPPNTAPLEGIGIYPYQNI